MNRLTRIVKLPESTLRKIPIPRNLISTVLSHQPLPHRAKLPHYPRRRNLSRFLTTAADRRKMEPSSPENLSSSVIDDFVNVENPEVEQSRLSSSSIENQNPNFVHVDRDGDGDGDGGGVVEERSSGVESVQSVENEESGNIEEIMRNVVVLTHENSNGDNCNVYLVGTAHVSQESCREVQAVISFLKPQVVFLELCSSRVSILTIKDLKVPTYSEMIDMWKKQQNVLAIVYSWFLAKVAEKLEVFPGYEFRVAFDEAMKCGSKVILGDRPVNITIRRTWNKMSLWHKTKLMYSLFFQAVFLPSAEDLDKMLKDMNDVDMLTLVIQEMSKQFPTLMETLVNERDRYMSSALFRIAGEHTSVVAVVGKGHLQGIKRNWKQPVEINELMEIPSPGPSVVKILSAIGVTVAGAAIVYGCFFASKKQS
ncbi:uncharacterized protein LOC141610657 [Silene latifolia]|uniref:uncharacterized protein LOC141610657 n=1 Tax=Silene latifolia TaxID=37657 RepID=UPI003D77505E